MSSDTSPTIRGNIGWLTIGNAVSKPLWLIFIAVLCVRVLGEDGYGVLTATLFLAALVNVFSDWGVTQYSIREVSRNPEAASSYLTNFLTLRILLSAATLALIVLAGYLLGYQGTKMTALVFAAAYTMLVSWTAHLQGFYRAIEVLKYEAISYVGEKLVVVAIGSTVLFLFRSTWAVLAAMAFSMLIVFVANLFWVDRRIASFKISLFDVKFVRKSLRYAIPLGLSAQFVMVYLRTDGVMVDYFDGDAAAGLYGLAFRTIEAIYILPGMVTTAVFPRLSVLFGQGDLEKIRSLIIKSGQWLAALGILVAVVLILGSRAVLLLLSGSQTFAAAAPALQILAAGLPFMFLNYLLSISLAATDNQNWLAAALGLAALFNVVTNLILIPEYSYFGAAAATTATEVLLLVGLASYLRRRLKKTVD